MQNDKDLKGAGIYWGRETGDGMCYFEEKWKKVQQRIG